VVGRRGVAEVLMPDMSAEERAALDTSAAALRNALRRVERKAA
jgi:malate/lactate dehydrogenase